MTWSENFPWDGETQYAKPVNAGSLPSVSPSWGSDVKTPAATNYGEATYTNLVDEQRYVVYLQLGGSPSSSDLRLGVMEPSKLTDDLLAKIGLIGTLAAETTR